MPDLGHRFEAGQEQLNSKYFMSMLNLSTSLLRLLSQKITQCIKSLLGLWSIWKHPQNRICRLLWLIVSLEWGAREGSRFGAWVTEWGRYSSVNVGVGWVLSGHVDCVRCCETLQWSHLEDSWIYGPGVQERDLHWKWRSGSSQFGDRSEAMGQIRLSKANVRSENKKVLRIKPSERSNLRGGQTEQKEPMKKT